MKYISYYTTKVTWWCRSWQVGLVHCVNLQAIASVTRPVVILPVSVTTHPTIHIINKIIIIIIYVYWKFTNRNYKHWNGTVKVTETWHKMKEKEHQLENGAINNVLPLKTARRDAIANLKCFWGLGHQRPMVTFTFTMRRHLIRLASAPFISSSVATFG